jgi:glucuronoarabinoxylan endo-1,4-beta-xylanase
MPQRSTTIKKTRFFKVNYRMMETKVKRGWATGSDLWKLFQYVWFLVIPMIFMGCDKSEENNPMLLSFVESSIPTTELSADGGNAILEVEWAKTTWSVSADDVVEGSEFITQITPANAGSETQGRTKTNVKITFAANKEPVANHQKLTLKSLTGNLTQTITLIQAAKVVVPTTVTINTATTYQKITGFGGGNMMWGTSFLTPSEIKTVFGQGEGELGFTMFRVRLSSVQSEWSQVVETIKEARKYEVTVLASPWSPPANLKTNNNVVGGRLAASNYGAYATYLNDFVQYMATQGATIDAVSVQNEPDFNASYEGCEWSSTEMYNFVKNNGAAIQGAKLVASESFNFKQSYTDAILNDQAAAANLDVVAGHLYGGGLASYPLAQQKGKEVWMTEYLLNLNSGNVQNAWINSTDAAKWDETMTMLGTVHGAMANNWNAYIWWYIRRYYSFIGDGEQGTVLGKILKRGYAMSHYAKFVRPGYFRVATSTNTNAALSITAYTGNNKVVVVLINNENYSFPEINLSVPAMVAAEAYTTSISLDRQKQSLSPVQNQVNVNLPARSITTVVIN